MTKIVCRSQYILSLKNIDRNKIYNKKDTKYINGIIDYYSNDKKRIMNMVDYFTGRINKRENINLVLENGKYATKEDIERRKRFINKQFNNSNIWQIVLSFDKNFVDKNISWRELEIKMAKEILPKFFKRMGFEDPKKMKYEFSLHTNTKHPHFHISFMEKEPNYINDRGKRVYMRMGKIQNELIKYLKRETVLTIEREKYYKPLSININKELDEFKKYFNPESRNYVLYDKSNILLEEKILYLGKLVNEKIISNNNRIKYNSIKDKEIKKLTKEIRNDLFIKNKNLMMSKSSFNKSIKEMNSYLTKITKENGISLKDIDLNYTENKELYLDNYILNAIVNYARYDYKKNESININPLDVIQSIAYQKYKDNVDLDKKQIVHNSFNNNYVMQYEVDNAVKNLNNEMKKAADEIYKIIKKKAKEKQK